MKYKIIVDVVFFVLIANSFIADLKAGNRMYVLWGIGLVSALLYWYKQFKTSKRKD